MTSDILPESAIFAVYKSMTSENMVMNKNGAYKTRTWRRRPF